MRKPLCRSRGALFQQEAVAIRSRYQGGSYAPAKAAPALCLDLADRRAGQVNVAGIRYGDVLDGCTEPGGGVNPTHR